MINYKIIKPQTMFSGHSGFKFDKNVKTFKFIEAERYEKINGQINFYIKEDIIDTISTLCCGDVDIYISDTLVESIKCCQHK